MMTVLFHTSATWLARVNVLGLLLLVEAFFIDCLL